MIVLDTRAKRCLENQFWPRRDFGPADVAELTVIDLLRIPNCGYKTVVQIVDWLDGFGLKPKNFDDVFFDDFRRRAGVPTNVARRYEQAWLTQ